MQTSCFNVTRITVHFSPDGEQTEKSPSDEGFTELEPAVDEEAEGTSTKTRAVVSGDRPTPGPVQGEIEDQTSPAQAKVKLAADEEDEGVAQNGSVEDAEAIREAEKTGDKETKDLKPAGIEELLKGAPVDQNVRSRLKEASECNLAKQSPDTPAGGAELSEEERRKKSYKAEVKSWLLEKMQAPIEGEHHALNPQADYCSYWAFYMINITNVNITNVCKKKIL